jgi:hypothetical protein
LAQSGATYAWNIINGTLLSGNGTNTIQVQWAGLAGVGKVMITLTKNACTVTDSLNIVINVQALDLNTSLTNPNCFGSNTGAISVIASGGFTPYQYKLNNGSYQTSNSFTNLSAGTYTVYVKDANNTIVSKIDTLINPIANSIGNISGLSAVATNSIKTYSISTQSGATYAWNIINGTLLSGNGTNSIQVQWAGLAGVGKVMISMTKNACTVTDSLNIVIGNPPFTVGKNNPLWYKFVIKSLKPKEWKYSIKVKRYKSLLFYNSRSAAWYSKVIKVGEMSVFYLY